MSFQTIELDELFSLASNKSERINLMSAQSTTFSRARVAFLEDYSLKTQKMKRDAAKKDV